MGRKPWSILLPTPCSASCFVRTAGTSRCSSPAASCRSRASPRASRSPTALARAIDVAALAHVEQLETRLLRDGRSRPRTSVSPRPMRRSTATGAPSLPCRPTMPSSSQPRRRGCARSSRTRTSASRSPRRRSRSRSCARSTSQRSGTTCRRRTCSGCSSGAACCERVEGLRAPGRAGGRPAALFRFASQRLEVTDEFAALRPPHR